MCMSTGNFDSFFFSELHPFWTLKFDKNERYYWLETVCQCNTSETVQQNFVKLYSNEGHNV